jgi:hypothetical protein
LNAKGGSSSSPLPLQSMWEHVAVIWTWFSG